jgi:hypothetical protein
MPVTLDTPVTATNRTRPSGEDAGQVRGQRTVRRYVDRAQL